MNHTAIPVRFRPKLPLATTVEASKYIIRIGGRSSNTFITAERADDPCLYKTHIYQCQEFIPLWMRSTGSRRSRHGGTTSAACTVFMSPPYVTSRRVLPQCLAFLNRPEQLMISFYPSKFTTCLCRFTILKLRYIAGLPC